MFKRNFIFQPSIFRGYVTFQGGYTVSIHCLRVVSLDAEIRGPQMLENQISCEQDVGNVSGWWFQPP